MFDIDFLTKADTSAAAKIEHECLDTAWSENQISNLPENAFYLVARQGNAVFGIASAYCVFDECQIMNIAVSPKFRRMGAGKALIERIFDLGREKGCSVFVLEVAEGNSGAISLYERCGFEKAGKRTGMFVMVKSFEF